MNNRRNDRKTAYSETEVWNVYGILYKYELKEKGYMESVL